MVILRLCRWWYLWSCKFGIDDYVDDDIDDLVDDDIDDYVDDDVNDLVD